MIVLLCFFCYHLMLLIYAKRLFISAPWIWTAAWQNHLCAQRRLGSVWASAQSDQSSLCAQWIEKDLNADSGDLGQTGRIPQADLSLRWAHRSFCWFCHAATHMVLACMLRGQYLFSTKNLCFGEGTQTQISVWTEHSVPVKNARN